MGVRVREKPKDSGIWWVFVNHQGRRKSKKIGSKEAAREVARKIEARLVLGELNVEKMKHKVPFFGEYAQLWLTGYVNQNLRQSTYEQYENILKKHLLPVFKNRPIDTINRSDVRELLLQNAVKLSHKRVLLIKDVLSGVLNWAVDEELIEVNPTAGIVRRLWPKSQRKKGTVHRNQVLKAEQAEELLTTCKKEFAQYYSFILTALRTGLRLGEILALRWGDIDFKERQIRVRRSYRRGRFTRPKSGRSRSVDMSDQLTETLKGMLTSQPKEIEDLVFNRNGQPIEQNYIRRKFKKILIRAEIPQIRLHDLRHTFASILLSQGVPIYYVSCQLGHSSIDITCDIYGHWLRTIDNRHVNVLDNPHSNAPYAHPVETKKPQPSEIAAVSN